MGEFKKVHINLVIEGDDFIALEKVRKYFGIMNYKSAVKVAITKAAEAIKNE
jgi:hypothetical protein